MIRAYRETGKYVIRVENEQALGTYATKERAMEVLDEIEQHAGGKVYVTEHGIERMPKVYQMPEE
jgi:hypothetical protein